MQKICNNLKTPYYTIHKVLLDEGLNKLKNALRSNWSNYIIRHSYKFVLEAGYRRRIDIDILL